MALYAKGMTTRDIQEIVQELYGVEVSPTLVSEITADLDLSADPEENTNVAAMHPGIVERLAKKIAASWPVTERKVQTAWTD